MEKTVKIRILNEVHIMIIGLHGSHLEYFYNKFAVLTEGYFFNPLYKLGRWDGKIRYFGKDGKTYLYLLDQIIPQLRTFGYILELEDVRETTAFQPDFIDHTILEQYPHLDYGTPIIIRDYQVEAVNSLIETGYGLCIAGTGSGKALSMDSKILTPMGWILNKDATVGGEILTPNGQVANIIGVYPQPPKQLYRITFHDGSSVECCGEHLWDAYVPKQWHKAWTDRKIITTDTIIAFLNRKKSGIYTPGHISIQLCNIIDRPNVDVPLDPYVLGALIGDGTLSNETIIFSNTDYYILDKVRQCVNVLGLDFKKIPTSNCDYAIVKQEAHTSFPPSANTLKSIIQQLDLNVKSNNKFVPDVYKNGSRAQRFDMIRGLLDTNGTVGKKGDISFTTVSKQLALDVQEIIWSLGGTCTITSRTPTFTYKGKKKCGQLAYTCFIRYKTPNLLVATPRKTERCRAIQVDGRVELTRRVVDIVPTKIDISQCIMIDHPDHLYITDDYIVTHNTFCCTALIKAYDKMEVKSITIVPNQSLIRQTKRDYINCGLDTGEYSGTTKTLNHKHVVSTWQALKNNPKIMNEFEMVIVDECHGLKGPQLQKIVCDHAARMPYRFGFTGTLPKDPASKMLVHVAIGPVRYEIPAHELITRGVLSTIQIDILQLDENLKTEYDQWCKDECVGRKPTYKEFKDGYFPDYDAEKSYIHRKENRIQWIANNIQTKLDSTGNVLCLVDSISFGRQLAALLPGAIFVNGQDVKKESNRQEIYELFKTRSDLIVIATVHIAGTGLSIDRIFNLITIDIGKSFIRVIQAAGRGLRKGGDKTHIAYTDICSDLKYGKKHLKERIDFYKEAKYPFKKHIIEYIKDTNIDL